MTVLTRNLIKGIEQDHLTLDVRISECHFILFILRQSLALWYSYLL